MKFYIIKQEFLKALSLLAFLILLTNHKLKIYIPTDPSFELKTWNTSFSNNLEISYYFDKLYRDNLIFTLSSWILSITKYISNNIRRLACVEYFSDFPGPRFIVIESFKISIEVSIEDFEGVKSIMSI